MEYIIVGAIGAALGFAFSFLFFRVNKAKAAAVEEFVQEVKKKLP